MNKTLISKNYNRIFLLYYKLRKFLFNYWRIKFNFMLTRMIEVLILKFLLFYDFINMLFVKFL